MANSVSFTMNAQQMTKLKSHYAKYEKSPAPAHAQALYVLPDCRITLYNSGKVLFQGNRAAQESELWQDVHATSPTNSAAKTGITTYIGCDETGVGDYFMPLVVAACYIDPVVTDKLAELNIKDSKQLDDAYISQIAPTLKKLVPHAIFTLANEKYNDFIDNGYNAHAIKAFVHNKAIGQLITSAKLPDDIAIVMDEFASKKNYLKYLKDISPVYVPTIFETKAENKYLGVAVASILARAEFLSIRKQQEKEYGSAFPLGASKAVDAFGAKFRAKFGDAAFKKNVKWHFANTQKILNANE